MPMGEMVSLQAWKEEDELGRYMKANFINQP